MNIFYCFTYLAVYKLGNVEMRSGLLHSKANLTTGQLCTQG